MTSSGFFVLRTPLLAFDELLSWGESLGARKAWETCQDKASISQAWYKDLEILRSRLRDIVQRSEVIQALFIASPSLESSIAYWKRDPDSKKGLQAERALVRYFERMAGRPTPFGLFSGCSIGRVSDEEGCQDSELVLEERQHYQCTTRLDFDCLFLLTESLGKNVQLRMDLSYWPNPSLLRIGGALHYIESRIIGTDRSHHLVKAYCDSHLDEVLRRAQTGARPMQLVQALLALPETSDISQDEALAYVQELIDNQIIVSPLVPLATGTSAIDDLIGQLESFPAGSRSAQLFCEVREDLAALNLRGIGAPVSDYRAIALKLEGFPAIIDIAQMFQVDLIKPLKNGLLREPITNELIKCVDLLCSIGRNTEIDDLRTFREAFSARYERAWVPLAEALHEDAGVCFGRKGEESSPILRGLQFSKSPSSSSDDINSLLLNKIAESATNALELVLDLSDLRSDHDLAGKLPYAFDLNWTLAASSVEALNKGDFRICLRHPNGPSGARFLGRFCYADTTLEAHVKEHLRREEEQDPEAIFAEVVYLPEGRVGNILNRPLLRHYEIPYMGRSGAEQEHQVPISDLFVTVTENGRIILFSKRLKKRVIPRLTSAHNFMNPKLAPIYRFLCCLQHEGGTGVPAFSWGSLEKLDFLPRLRVGRIVLSTARWRLSAHELKKLGGLGRAETFIAVQELRSARRLPRWVVYTEGDNALPVDLDNALSVDALIHVLKRTQQAILHEMYPGPDELCVAGPEGRFQHDFVTPFVRSKPAVQSIGAHAADTSSALGPLLMRSAAFPPGSEWLYLKVYGGVAALDDVLVGPLRQLSRQAFSSGLVSQWFFVRYADPNEHLRIRFHGRPKQLTEHLLPLLCTAFNHLLTSRQIWKLQFDTYERELQRYGGAEGIIAAEQVFYADSEAVLSILESLEDDNDQELRWCAALVGVDALFADSGSDLQERLRISASLRDSFQSEFKVDQNVKQQLDARFRRERRRIESFLEDSHSESSPIRTTHSALRRRSTEVGDAFARLRHLNNRGDLQIDSLVGSLIHMHVNRLIRSSAREHELILYNFLTRIYESRLARRVSLPISHL